MSRVRCHMSLIQWVFLYASPNQTAEMNLTMCINEPLGGGGTMGDDRLQIKWLKILILLLLVQLGWKLAKGEITPGGNTQKISALSFKGLKDIDICIYQLRLWNWYSLWLGKLSLLYNIKRCVITMFIKVIFRGFFLHLYLKKNLFACLAWCIYFFKSYMAHSGGGMGKCGSAKIQSRAAFLSQGLPLPCCMDWFPPLPLPCLPLGPRRSRFVVVCTGTH